MRTTIVRRTLAVAGAAAIVAATVVGCSSDDSSDTASTSSSASSSEASSSSAESTSAAAESDPATVQAITDTYTKFFDSSTAPEVRATLVANGPNFLPLLQAQAANPANATTTVVHSVSVTDAANAAVNYDLVVGGVPALPDQNGEAVFEDGTWKVAAVTFCTLASIQGGGGAAIPGC